MQGIHAKLARALEHLMSLADAAGGYLDKDPVAIGKEMLPDGSEVWIGIRIKEPPPLDLAVGVGDVVHQLRSSLDHVAALLVEAAGERPTRKTRFPVCVKQPPRLTIAGGVPPAALELVEQFQPYQRRDAALHPLAVLNKLWNIDKHRSIHLTAAKSARSQVFLRDPASGALVGGQFQAAATPHGGAIGYFRFSSRIPEGVEIIASGDSFVAFADEGPWGTEKPVIEILEELHQYVTVLVVPRFERLLSRLFI